MEGGWWCDRNVNCPSFANAMVDVWFISLCVHSPARHWLAADSLALSCLYFVILQHSVTPEMIFFRSARRGCSLWTERGLSNDGVYFDKVVLDESTSSVCFSKLAWENSRWGMTKYSVDCRRLE